MVTTEDQTAYVWIRSELDVVTARQTARTLAMSLRFGPVELTELVTAVSEIGNNIAQYGGGGEMWIHPLSSEEGWGIKVIAADRGPGIEDPEAALRGEYSTGGGLGLGLSGARRLMDEFELQTAAGRGTTIWMTKWAVRRTRGVKTRMEAL